MSVVKYAPKAHQLLNGVFAVYKPSGIPIKSLIKEIKDRLLQDINGMEQRPMKQMIVFKPAHEVLSSGSDKSSGNNLPSNVLPAAKIPVNVPDWFDHPLVQGNRYTGSDLLLFMGHVLDVHACGVQVLGLQKPGKDTLSNLKKLTLPRRYKVKGRFGLASLTFSGESRIVEKSTWDHVTEEKIDRILTIIQGAHRNACIVASGVDLCSQQAYTMASKGLLKPRVPTEAVILDVKLADINLPEFTLDVTCINESCIYVRKIIHEIGLELRTNAICTQLQRVQDSVFTVDDKHTLLGHQVNVNNILESIKHSKFLLRQGVMKRKRYFRKTRVDYKDESEQNLLPSGESLEEFIENGDDNPPPVHQIAH